MMRKYLFILVLFFMLIPLGVRADVFEGAGTKTFTVKGVSSTSFDSCGNGLSCSAEITATHYSCPSGATLSGGQCRKETVRSSAPNDCSGGTWTNGQCHTWTNSTPTKKYDLKVTVTYDGNHCGQSSSVKIGDTSNTYYFWKSPSFKSIDLWTDVPQKTRDTADNVCYDLYNQSGGKYYGSTFVNHYTSVSSRCCQGIGPIPQPSYPSECYRKPDPSGGSYIYKWTNVLFDNSVSGWEVINLTEEKCTSPNPTSCNVTSNVIEKKDSSSKYCSAKNVNVDLKSGEACGENSTSFYSITCSDKVYVDYVPQGFSSVSVNGTNDDKVAILMSGQGFGFNVIVRHQKSCSGTFDKNNNFNTAYNRANTLVSRAEQAVKSKMKNATNEYAWAVNIRNGIENIVKSYKEQYSNLTSRSEYSFRYDGTISLDYKFNGKQKTKSVPLTVNDSSTMNLDDFKKSNSQRLANNEIVDDFTYTLSENTILEPQQVYFDKYTGLEVSSSTTTSKIDGGHKFYTDLKTDANKNNEVYDININIDVYNGSTVVANIKNDQCDLKIYENELKYRIINVSNPFVNSARQIAENWKNSKQDFTGVIDKEIWNKSPLYSFNLPKDKIIDVQKSNNNDSNSYLGTCHKSENSQSTVMKDICSIINSK